MAYFLRCVTFWACLFMFHSIHYGNSNDSDGPLFLTPYLSDGNIGEARARARVNMSESEFESYSGFITVNKSDNSNMFFWFFPVTECCDKDVPLLIWLQGGPGGSGLAALFLLNGPYFLYSNLTIGLRKHAWTTKFNVIYVDNPVGTGYSFTDTEDGYARSEDQVADNLYEFLQQFFIMFPEYKGKDFYVTGVSYGGKYVSALSYKIHLEGRKSGINFKGMAIGNGFCDPETMTDYSPHYYQLGLVDQQQAAVLKDQYWLMQESIIYGDYLLGTIAEPLLEMFQYEMMDHSAVKKFTGFNYYYNLLYSEAPEDVEYYKKYAEKPEVRKALHVGNSPFHGKELVAKHLGGDILRSVKPQVTVIMNNNYKVIFYNGQLDLAIPWTLTVNFLNSVKWKYASEYKKASRIIWRLKDSNYIAGYVHKVKNFTEVMVRNAGHFVPQDQPEASLDLIYRFVYDIPFEE